MPDTLRGDPEVDDSISGAFIWSVKLAFAPWNIVAQSIQTLRENHLLRWVMVDVWWRALIYTLVIHGLHRLLQWLDGIYTGTFYSEGFQFLGVVIQLGLGTWFAKRLAERVKGLYRSDSIERQQTFPAMIVPMGISLFLMFLVPELIARWHQIYGLIEYLGMRPRDFPHYFALLWMIWLYQVALSMMPAIVYTACLDQQGYRGDRLIFAGYRLAVCAAILCLWSLPWQWGAGRSAYMGISQFLLLALLVIPLIRWLLVQQWTAPYLYPWQSRPEPRFLGVQETVPVGQVSFGESLHWSARTIFTPWVRMPHLIETWDEIPVSRRILRKLLPKAVVLGLVAVAVNLVLAYIYNDPSGGQSTPGRFAIVAWALTNLAFLWFAIDAARVAYQYAWEENESMRMVPMLFRERFHSMQLPLIAAVAVAEVPRTAVAVWDGVMPHLERYHRGSRRNVWQPSLEGLANAFVYTAAELAGVAVVIGFLCLVFIIAVRRRGWKGKGPRPDYVPVTIALGALLLGACIGSCTFSTSRQNAPVPFVSSLISLAVTALFTLPTMRYLWMREYAQARRELFRNEA